MRNTKRSEAAMRLALSIYKASKEFDADKSEGFKTLKVFFRNGIKEFSTGAEARRFANMIVKEVLNG